MEINEWGHWSLCKLVEEKGGVRLVKYYHEMAGKNFTHTYLHLRLSAYMYVHIVLFAYKSICILTYLHPHVFASTRIWIHTYLHPHVFASTRICIHTYLHPHVFASTRICIYVYFLSIYVYLIPCAFASEYDCICTYLHLFILHTHVLALIRTVLVCIRFISRIFVWTRLQKQKTLFSNVFTYFYYKFSLLFQLMTLVDKMNICSKK